MARAEALQNVRVWARRLHVGYEEAKASNFMDDFHPGSVLIGPLTYLFAKRNNRDIKLGAICANTLVSILRGENGGKNIHATSLQEAEKLGMLAVWSGSYQLIISEVEFAIQQRNAEKAKPNFTNYILNRVREGR